MNANRLRIKLKERVNATKKSIEKMEQILLSNKVDAPFAIDSVHCCYINPIADKQNESSLTRFKKQGERNFLKLITFTNKRQKFAKSSIPKSIHRTNTKIIEDSSKFRYFNLSTYDFILNLMLMFKNLSSSFR